MDLADRVWLGGLAVACGVVGLAIALSTWRADNQLPDTVTTPALIAGVLGAVGLLFGVIARFRNSRAAPWAVAINAVAMAAAAIGFWQFLTLPYGH